MTITKENQEVINVADMDVDELTNYIKALEDYLEQRLEDWKI